MVGILFSRIWFVISHFYIILWFCRKQQKRIVELIHFIFRGDYVCDVDDTQTLGNRANQPHVAAWEAPGMDYLSEEQTLKYLNRSNSIEVATKSPSVATTG